MVSRQCGSVYVGSESDAVNSEVMRRYVEHDVQDTQGRRRQRVGRAAKMRDDEFTRNVDEFPKREMCGVEREEVSQSQNQDRSRNVHVR